MPQQIAYLKNRNINEGGRLISHISEICSMQKTNDYLLTIDIEKVCDSVNHNFLIKVLEKLGFKTDFVSWIKNLLCNQESRIINNDSATKYFHLEKGACQYDPISSYLLTVALEVLFILIKNNSDIKRINIFDQVFLCTEYANGSNFFVLMK